MLLTQIHAEFHPLEPNHVASWEGWLLQLHLPRTDRKEVRSQLNLKVHEGTDSIGISLRRTWM